MALISRNIGKQIRRADDVLQNGTIVAAVEVGEATDKQKAIDTIRKAISSSNSVAIIVVKI